MRLRRGALGELAELAECFVEVFLLDVLSLRQWLMLRAMTVGATMVAEGKVCDSVVSDTAWEVTA